MESAQIGVRGIMLVVITLLSAAYLSAKTSTTSPAYFISKAACEPASIVGNAIGRVLSLVVLDNAQSLRAYLWRKSKKRKVVDFTML